MIRPESAIIFAPEAEIAEVHQLELAASVLLKDLNCSVRMVTCSRDLLPLCPAMISHDLSLKSPESERVRTCERCEITRNRGEIQSGISPLPLSNFIDPSDYELAKRLRLDITRENYSSFSFAGIAVGRYATYLPLLRYKVSSVAVEENVWNEYLAELESIVWVIRAAERLFDAYQPSLALSSNHLYGTHRAFLQVARDRGVEAWGLSAGLLMPKRTDSLLLLPDEVATQTLALSESVAWSRTQEASELEIQLVSGHIHSLVRGSDPWVYSSMSRGLAPSEIREILGLRPDSKVVTVLLSSPDETRATTQAGAEFRVGDRAGFLTGPVFLGHVMRAAASLGDYDFVFRLHPRMFPNERESVLSPDLPELMRLLESLPSNGHLCLPDHGISLYDNIAISDAAVNFTSSSGLEFMLFGIPVFHLDGERLGAYPEDLGIHVPSPDLLSDVIEAGIKEGWQKHSVIKVVRWWISILVRIAVFPYGAEAMRSAPAVGATPPDERSRSIRRLVGAALPNSVKRRLGELSLDKQRENFTFAMPVESAQAELARALMGSVSGGIWDPEILLRGEPSDDESGAILKAIADVIQVLGWHSWSASERSRAGVAVRLLETVEDLQ